MNIHESYEADKNHHKLENLKVSAGDEVNHEKGNSPYLENSKLFASNTKRSPDPKQLLAEKIESVIDEHPKYYQHLAGFQKKHKFY